jgi:hypothetical protein
MDDSVVTQNQQVTSTNGMHLWQAFSAGDISLNAGKHVLRMYALRGGFNLQSIRFSKVK